MRGKGLYCSTILLTVVMFLVFWPLSIIRSLQRKGLFIWSDTVWPYFTGIPQVILAIFVFFFLQTLLLLITTVKQKTYFTWHNLRKIFYTPNSMNTNSSRGRGRGCWLILGESAITRISRSMFSKIPMQYFKFGVTRLAKLRQEHLLKEREGGSLR